jgi:DNA repair photolyase
MILCYNEFMLLTPFDPWQNNRCTCPKKYSLSSYTGCGHGCLYCYATSYIPDFFAPRPKKDFLARLKKDILNVPPGALVAMANSSDPYQPLEKKLCLTREALKIIAEKNLRLTLVTKSALIARDCDIIKNMHCSAAITITTLKPNLAKEIEPRAPAPQKRLAALEKLSKSIFTAVRLDPIICGINEAEIEDIVMAAKNHGARQIITSTYKAKPDNFKRLQAGLPVQTAKLQNLYFKEPHKISGQFYLEESLRLKLIERCRTAALSAGLQFSSCREGFGRLNTATCDASV